MANVISKRFISILLLLFISTHLLNANEVATHQEGQKEKFDTQKLIIEHITDAYQWHIFSLHNFHLSVPLPVIVYSKTTGLHIFLSNNIMHSTEAYEGFKIGSEGGKYKGKIVEISASGEEIRPIDLSITKNTLSLFIGIAILFSILFTAAKRYRTAGTSAPKGVQGWLEPLILFVRDDIAKASIGEEKYMKYLPFLLTLFFFILINNFMGLIPFFPGGANLSGNTAFTIVLALFTFLMVHVNASRDYWTHLVNTPGIPLWLKLPIPLMPFVEIMGVFIKPFVLMVRLFANITAGHIIVLSFYSLIFIFADISIYAGYGASIIAIPFTIFMGVLEILVSLIQAYVFTLLSAIYISFAIESHSKH